MSEKRYPPNSTIPYGGSRLGSRRGTRTAAQRKRDEERKAREFARKYHSLERVWYVAEHLACCVPGCNASENDNAHLLGAAGVGYKAGYETTGPLCTGPHGHHRELDTTSRARFEERYGVDLEKVALDTEESWQLYGAEVVARAKADGRFQRWLDRPRRYT